MNLPSENNWNSFWNSNKQSQFTKISWSKKRIEEVLLKYIKKNCTVLDAGCGSGYFSNMFLKYNCQVYSLDYSKEAIDIAKKLTSGQAKYIIGDLLDEKFCDKYKGKFDLIFSDGLFEHFTEKDQIKILKNFIKMKSKRGVITTFVPNKFSFWEVIRPIFMPQIKEDPFTLKDLENLSKKVGIKVIESGGLNVLPLKLSPEKLGKYLGMILFSISK
ncbi:MAG TPA: class I SAM-dependent methyltransferase [Candidatus Woesebacteria bacterium]|nr:class I SAM-dependent methyltransferase [Candidatus Woesebacteria bacterium]